MPTNDRGYALFETVLCPWRAEGFLDPTCGRSPPNQGLPGILCKSSPAGRSPCLGGPYDVSAQISGFSEDPDVFLLGDCNLGQCIGTDTYGNDTAMASGLGPGLYYIAVDGYDYAASDYTLELSCSSAEFDNEAYLPLVVRD